jgi:hypothetical protein
MKAYCCLLWTVSILAVAGCATTEFKPFEAKVNSYEGKGGTKTIVGGMELWDNGDPPRTYKILGIIEDRRGSGLIPMASLQSDIVQKAREVGGDAVIQLGSESRITGVYTTGSASAYQYGRSATAYGSSTSVPLGKTFSKFVVIKYLE